MAKHKKPPELVFQQHIADFLVSEHGYGVLEQSDITDTENNVAEDLLWAFLNATQTDTLKKLSADYGTAQASNILQRLLLIAITTMVVTVVVYRMQRCCTCCE